jgi:hypothetical protein
VAFNRDGFGFHLGGYLQLLVRPNGNLSIQWAALGGVRRDRFWTAPNRTERLDHYG